MENELIELLPTINKMLKNGKTIQIEYNKKGGEIKLLECKFKRIKVGGENDY